MLDRTITWQQVSDELADYQPIFLNDYYGDDLPGDKKVLALRLSFDAADHTLTDAEADKRLREVVAKLKQAFDATER